MVFIILGFCCEYPIKLGYFMRFVVIDKISMIFETSLLHTMPIDWEIEIQNHKSNSMLCKVYYMFGHIENPTMT